MSGSVGKKNRHVYRSGATASGGGDAKVDKRGEERPCPHCERVFKQMGRLQEHVRKKHAKELEVANRTGSEKKEEDGSKIEGTVSAGTYSQKTPRQFLHEWCQKHRKPNPRYVPKEAKDGTRDVEGCGWTCKVVLPSTKGSKDDVVRYSRKPAATKEEAIQRAALVGLQHVMAGRSMHVILPREYREEWLELERASKDREDRREKLEGHREARKAQQKSVAEREARKMPQVVVMTEARRREVEEVLRTVRGPERVQLSSSDVVHVKGREVEVVSRQLHALGFRPQDVERAIHALASRGGYLERDSAIDWICLHADERDLPEKYAPLGASGAPLRVLHRADSIGVEMSSEQKADPDLAYLIACGYPLQQSVDALVSAGGERRLALETLYRGMVGEEEGTPLEGDEVWEEEVYAIGSIYEDDADCTSSGRISVAVRNLDEDHIQLDDNPSVFLDVYKPLIGGYPQVLPTLALRSEILTGGQRLLLSQRLGEGSKQLRGGVMVHALLEMLPELFATVQSQDVDPQDLLVPRVDVGEGQEKRSSAKARRGPRSASENQAARGEFDEAAESSLLLSQQRRLATSPKHFAMSKVRRNLPAFAMRDVLLEKIRSNRVLVLSGETGCGKSTQVPQYILEEAIENGKGSTCSIVCTQPRRISAVGLATRVALERDETVGDVVGYSVRLDTKVSRRTRLLYCTTGVLLRRLINDPSLSSTTHIVVDEVHERSLDSDLLLLLLRNVLQSRDDLKLVLMSATADAELFANYFKIKTKVPASVAMANVPGFTHPVQDFFLEDVIQTISYKPRGRSSTAPKEHSVGTPSNGSFSLQGYNDETVESLLKLDLKAINYDLIVAVICFLARPGEKNAFGEQDAAHGNARCILVFLPGVAEINRLRSILKGSHSLCEALGSLEKLQLHILHGGMQTKDQQAAFQKQKPGQLKIVLATNVAETSITIDDVTFVIDLGKHKELRFDPARGIATLKETWISKASARQRRGRAGRVCAGTCLKLYTKERFSSMQEHQEPEIQRVPLESLCLQLKKVLGGSIRHHLSLALSPPCSEAVGQAISNLLATQALNQEEELTPLGHHLSLMPVDIHIGKMLIYGVLLKCLDPILTIAAAMSGQWPFLSTQGHDEDERQARDQLAGTSNQSDHLAVVAAYDGWRKCKQAGTDAGFTRREFCNRYLLSEQALQSIDKMRKEFVSIMQALGFLPSELGLQAKNRQSHGVKPGAIPPDDHGDMGRVIKSVVCAAFYPKLVRVEHPATKYKQIHGGTIAEDAPPQSIRFYVRNIGRVFLHPSSVNFTSGKFESGWLVYTNMVETSKIFVRESSMVPPYAILFFGGAVEVIHEEGLLVVDQWARFRAPARIAVLVRELRAEVDSLLLSKINAPDLEISCSPLVDVLLRLVSHNGF